MIWVITVMPNTRGEIEFMSQRGLSHLYTAICCTLRELNYQCLRNQCFACLLASAHYQVTSKLEKTRTTSAYKFEFFRCAKCIAKSTAFFENLRNCPGFELKGIFFTVLLQYEQVLFHATLTWRCFSKEN